MDEHEIVIAAGVTYGLVKALLDKVVRKPRGRIHNLPLRNLNFTGRRAQLDVLHSALCGGKTTVVTQAILGLGGIGKTQLAIEYCHEHSREYSIIWWLRSEEPTTLLADYAELALRLGLPKEDATNQSAVALAVRAWLEGNKGWLLIFDNAPGPSSVSAYLPRGCPGCVIITSRHPNWSGVAKELELPLLPRRDSVQFLLNRTLSKDQTDAEKLAERLGDLPLALEQAAAYMSESACTIEQYLERLEANQAEVLKWRSKDAQYPESVASTWEVSTKSVERDSPVGAALLNIAAFLAPDNIPLDLLLTKEARLPPGLVPAVADPVQLDRAKAALKELSLASFEGENMSVHRLVQAVTQDRIGAVEKRGWVEAALTAVNSVYPTESSDVRLWPQCARLLSHVNAVCAAAEAAEADLPLAAGLRSQAGVYLVSRALYTEAEPLLRRALTVREKVLGPEHPEVARSLNNLAELLQYQGRLAEAEPLYRRALTVREKVLGPEHPDVAASLHHLAMLLFYHGKLAEAEPPCRRALTVREKVLGPEHPDVAASLTALAELLHAWGKLAEAEPLYRRSLTIYEKVLGPEHRYVATTLGNLAVLVHDQGKLAEAEPLFRRSLTIFEKVLGPEHPEVAGSLDYLAMLLMDQGKLAEAEPLGRRSLTIFEKVLGPEHYEVARSLNNMAGILLARGKLAEAEPLYRRSLTIYEKVLGPEHYEVATSLHNLAMLLKNQDKLGEAEPLFRRALAIREKVLGPEHPAVANSLNGLAALLLDRGKLGEAEPLFRRALAIREKVLGPEHPDVATILNNLAMLLKSQGKLGEAELLLRRALAIREKVLGPEHHYVATSLNNLALLLQSQGKLTEAEPLFRRALTIREKALGPEHPDVATSLNVLAALLRDQGKVVEAEPLFQRALTICEKSLGPDHPNTRLVQRNLEALRNKR